MTRLLARAFEDDPQTHWLHPRENSRLKRSRMSFELSFRHSYRLSDGVDIAVDQAGGIVGSGLWIATSHMTRPATIGDHLRLRRAHGFRTRLALDTGRLLWSSHVPEPHWHLLALATAVEVRGRGFGDALMEWGLHRCRADGLPAHLETTNHRNVAFYKRFGFEVTGEVGLPGGGPRAWLMRYQP